MQHQALRLLANEWRCRSLRPGSKRRTSHVPNLMLMNMGLINKVDMGMFVACGIWCLADVSSVSPSSEQSAPSEYSRAWGHRFEID